MSWIFPKTTSCAACCGRFPSGGRDIAVFPHAVSSGTRCFARHVPQITSRGLFAASLPQINHISGGKGGEIPSKGEFERASDQRRRRGVGGAGSRSPGAGE